MTNIRSWTVLAVALVACGGKLDDDAARTDAGSVSAASPTPSSPSTSAAAEPSTCQPPSNGCDLCGDLSCPAGSVVDSACKCLDDGAHRYVAPTSQACDFCCGKRCAAGQFLDWRCECYDPAR